MPNRSSSASFRESASLISLPTTVPIFKASAIVSEWKLPAPVFRTAVTFPDGVTPITTHADAHASSSGAGSTMQWLPIRVRVTRTGALDNSSLFPSYGSSESSISGSPPSTAVTWECRRENSKCGSP